MGKPSYRFRIAGGAVVVATVLAVTFGSVVSVRAALLPRVNDALTQGGFSLTYENWKPFAAGVVSGHYKSFEQLADAAKYHKQQGTLPNESKFAQAVAAGAGKVAGATTTKKICFSGQVKSGPTLLKKVKGKPQEGRMTVEFSRAKKVTTQPIAMNFGQYTVAKGRSVHVASTVKTCVRGTLDPKKSLPMLGNVQNLTPAADPDDSSGGGGGGGGSGGEPTY